jgi:hypothetical protein
MFPNLRSPEPLKGCTLNDESSSISIHNKCDFKLTWYRLPSFHPRASRISLGTKLSVWAHRSDFGLETLKPLQTRLLHKLVMYRCTCDHVREWRYRLAAERLVYHGYRRLLRLVFRRRMLPTFKSYQPEPLLWDMLLTRMRGTRVGDIVGNGWEIRSIWLLHFSFSHYIYTFRWPVSYYDDLPTALRGHAAGGVLYHYHLVKACQALQVVDSGFEPDSRVTPGVHPSRLEWRICLFQQKLVAIRHRPVQLALFGALWRLARSWKEARRKNLGYFQVVIAGWKYLRYVVMLQVTKNKYLIRLQQEQVEHNSNRKANQVFTAEKKDCNRRNDSYSAG